MSTMNGLQKIRTRPFRFIHFKELFDPQDELWREFVLNKSKSLSAGLLSWFLNNFLGPKFSLNRIPQVARFASGSVSCGAYLTDFI